MSLCTNEAVCDIRRNIFQRYEWAVLCMDWNSVYVSIKTTVYVASCPDRPPPLVHLDSIMTYAVTLRLTQLLARPRHAQTRAPGGCRLDDCIAASVASAASHISAGRCSAERALDAIGGGRRKRRATAHVRSWPCPWSNRGGWCPRGLHRAYPVRPISECAAAELPPPARARYLFLCQFFNFEICSFGYLVF
jgi:hypothetical protein